MEARRSGREEHGYRAIADTIREQIRAGGYSAGALLPTEKELQTAFGVSRTTIRRALAVLAESGWAEVKPKRGVSARLGPMPAQGGNVAYVDYGDVINERVFFGIGRRLQDAGYHLIHVDSRTYGEAGALEYGAERGFVAAFVWSKEGFPDLERMEAIRRKMPVIALDHRMSGIETDLVSEDNLEGAAAAVRHLADQGRKRIAVSGMMDMLEVNHDRFSGYLKALFQSGLRPHPVDFQFCVSSGDAPEEIGMLVNRLKQPDRPDSIFVLQDMCVPYVVEAIFEAGLRIPEDITVAAFGGETPIQIDDVSLTSMMVDWPMFAERCVEVLLGRLTHPSQPFVTSILPAKLVIRGSCGAPREQWDSLPTKGVENFVGPRWSVRQEYLHIRSS